MTIISMGFQTTNQELLILNVDAQSEEELEEINIITGLANLLFEGYNKNQNGFSLGEKPPPSMLEEAVIAEAEALREKGETLTRLVWFKNKLLGELKNSSSESTTNQKDVT